MTKYFSIAIAGATPEQEKAIAAAWRGLGWWHGVSNFWLLRDHNANLSAVTIRDQIRSIAPEAKIMVVEMSPTTWAANVITEPNRDWLRKYWPPEGS